MLNDTHTADFYVFTDLSTGKNTDIVTVQDDAWLSESQWNPVDPGSVIAWQYNEDGPTSFLTVDVATAVPTYLSNIPYDSGDTASTSTSSSEYFYAFWVTPPVAVQVNPTNGTWALVLLPFVPTESVVYVDSLAP